MRRLREVFGQVAFHLLVFSSGFILVNWPLMSIFQHRHPRDLLPYFFIIWAVLVVFLFLIGTSLRAADHEDREGKGREDGPSEGDR